MNWDYENPDLPWYRRAGSKLVWWTANGIMLGYGIAIALGILWVLVMWARG